MVSVDRHDYIPVGHASESRRIAWQCHWLADSPRQVSPLRCAQEEFLSAYGEQVAVAARQEAIQLELEACGEDMEKMAALLDELQARCCLVAHYLVFLSNRVFWACGCKGVEHLISAQI